MKEYVFFTMNNFEKEGGGTIRMYGILNSLSKSSRVTLISNAIDTSKFHEDIQHIPLNFVYTPRKKREFQLLLTYTPIPVVNLFNLELLKLLKNILSKYSGKNIFFFEYLDNSIGFWLKRNNVLKSYTNDLHGVATIEFDYQREVATNYRQKVVAMLKYKSAYILDKKVLSNAFKNIYASNAMMNYFKTLYPKLKDKPHTIVPYLLPLNSNKNSNPELVRRILIKYNVSPKDKVIMFAGAFKPTGGVMDLIKAFEMIHMRDESVLLMLVGDGVEQSKCKSYVNHSKLGEKIIFVGRTPYDHLSSYQDIAHVLVCPDTDNEFSNLIVHVKYLDALLANKVVVNGSFDSVLEINPHEELSPLFEPSNVDMLATLLGEILRNYDDYKEKYGDTKQIVLSTLTYSSISTL